MAIYIKEIPMPKDGEHAFWIALHSDGTVEYNANKGNGWQMTTAVPVPPHGDLIDRAELVDSFDSSDFWNPSAEDNCLAAIHVVNSMPTIIPAEEGET